MVKAKGDNSMFTNGDNWTRNSNAIKLRQT
jgi:hypothetical protein